jgi:hypothetical protein
MHLGHKKPYRFVRFSIRKRVREIRISEHVSREGVDELVLGHGGRMLMSVSSVKVVAF